MKNITLFLGILFILSSCSAPEISTEEKNKVIVIGTIHSGHLTEKEYSVDVLKDIIRKINPDIILTEIPPDRFEIAMEEFQTKDTITEPRVKLFPEYVNVIFPLSKEMDFKIIPTAGWTKEMSDARQTKLKEISTDSSRTEEWSQLLYAEKRSDSFMKLSHRENDPYWINSSAYDSIAEIELSVYNDLFNEELGLGGWNNINEAHYSYIKSALDEYKNQGKTILITYGAGHKGWFLRELKKREDIELMNLSDF